MTDNAITTEKLCKRFRSVDALRELNLHVPSHCVYALIGPNGAGKTTTMKVLMNAVQPTSGRATVLGIDSRQLSGHAFAQIGYVSENQEMPEWMRVGELFRYLRAFYPTWDLQLETELVRQFSLPLNRKLKDQSRGMRMKTALASSLAYRPKLIVLDEPFTGLDPLVRDELVEAITRMAAEATVFVSSHDLAEVENIATHVGYLDEGTLRFSEELGRLSERFREVHVTFADTGSGATLPETWLQVEMSNAAIHFVDSEYDESSTKQKIRTSFGERAEISVDRMSLRSIFVAVAKGKTADKLNRVHA